MIMMLLLLSSDGDDLSASNYSRCNILSGCSLFDFAKSLREAAASLSYMLSDASSLQPTFGPHVFYFYWGWLYNDGRLCLLNIITNPRFSVTIGTAQPMLLVFPSESPVPS